MVKFTAQSLRFLNLIFSIIPTLTVTFLLAFGSSNELHDSGIDV